LKTVQKVVPKETVFEHNKEHVTFKDRFVDVPIDKIEYEYHQVDVKIEDIVPKPVPVQMVFETVQEHPVYQDFPVDVPVTVVVPKYKDVEVQVVLETCILALICC
jgi:hypothetical protein